MSNRILFVFNLLSSLFYTLFQNHFSQLADSISLFLLIFLFIYTSMKIKNLNNNPSTVSRFIIMLACTWLISTIFSQPANINIYRNLAIIVILITEAYEFFLKKRAS